MTPTLNLAPSADSEELTALRNAFLLGATIAELQGRIRVTVADKNLGDPSKKTNTDASERASFVPYVEVDSDVAWVTSAWRVLFERLSLLHNEFFEDSTTEKTRYDPGI